MKKVLYIIIILFSITLINEAFAINYETCVDQWIDGKAYCHGELVYDEWSVDLETGKYVLLDENGYKIREVDSLEDDPQAKKGNIHIKANVPSHINDCDITIHVYSSIYTYEFVLNRQNNYEINEKMVVDTYSLESVSASGDYKLPDIFPNTFRIREDDTYDVELNYYQYFPGEKEKENKLTKILLIVGLSVIALFVIILVYGLLKARSV